MKTTLKSFSFYFVTLALIFPYAAQANHGPGTSGGSSSTEPGETLTEGQFIFSIREEYTKYRSIGAAAAADKARNVGEFDSIRDAFLTSFSATYGITDDLQIEANLGWYSGRGFLDSEIEGEHHHEERLSKAEAPEEVESSSANPAGLTDIALRGKYRLLRGKPGNFALIGGVVLPTGDDSELLDNGEKLEPSSQPGTGRFGYQGGLAYSRYLSSNVTVDASSIYAWRVERNGFDIGDRLDTSLALAYRVTDDIRAFPQVSVFGELNYVWIGKDKSEEGTNLNSGGDSLYLTPGARLRLTEKVAFTLAPSFPVAQNLNGEQVETDFKILGTLTVAL